MIVRGDTFVEGIDVIIRRDLDKHKDLLEKNILDIQAFQATRSNEINRKQYYREQKGKRKYRDEDMDKAIRQMNKNIASLTVQIRFAEDLKKNNTLIVDTLTQQLGEYNEKIKELANRNNKN